MAADASNSEMLAPLLERAHPRSGDQAGCHLQVAADFALVLNQIGIRALNLHFWSDLRAPAVSPSFFTPTTCRASLYRTVAPRSATLLTARHTSQNRDWHIQLLEDSSAKLTQPRQRHDQYVTWVEFDSGTREITSSGQILSFQRLI